MSDSFELEGQQPFRPRMYLTTSSVFSQGVTSVTCIYLDGLLALLYAAKYLNRQKGGRGGSPPHSSLDTI